MAEDRRSRMDADNDALRAALRDALGEGFLELLDLQPDLIAAHSDHLRELVETSDPVERMQLARAYASQLEQLRYPTYGQPWDRLRGLLSPAEALAERLAAKDTARPSQRSGQAADETDSPPVDSAEHASAQLRLQVERWLGEVEMSLRRIDTNILERMEADDRSAIEDEIDRIRSRLLFIVSGRGYPD